MTRPRSPGGCSRYIGRCALEVKFLGIIRMLTDHLTKGYFASLGNLTLKGFLCSRSSPPSDGSHSTLFFAF